MLEQWATKILPETPRVREDGDNVDGGRRSRLRGDDPNPNQRDRKTRGTIPLGLRARYPLNQPTREKKGRRGDAPISQFQPTSQERCRWRTKGARENLASRMHSLLRSYAFRFAPSPSRPARREACKRETICHELWLFWGCCICRRPRQRPRKGEPPTPQRQEK